MSDIWVYRELEPGKIPARQELTVLPADKERSTSIGFVCNEVMGVAVVNSRAVWRLVPWYKKMINIHYWKYKLGWCMMSRITQSERK